MEPLPRGAQFKRAKMLWEIGLGVAGDTAIPYYGNRDIAILVGNGSDRVYKPALRMAVGSPILAKGVVDGELDVAFVNPSAVLTQAYRGTGMYTEPLPVRVLASYPSWDRYVMTINPATGLKSLAEVKARKYPLRVSIREDTTHSTRVLQEQLFAFHGFSFDDIVSWGGSLQLNGPPMDPRRMAAIKNGEVDAVWDEGIVTWFDEALAAGMEVMPFDESELKHLTDIGWRRVTIPAGKFANLKRDYECIDYSGWPLYTRASLSDEDAWKICDAIAQRSDEIPWEDSYTGIGQIGAESEATPLDVPLHPGAERWYREHGHQV